MLESNFKKFSLILSTILVAFFLTTPIFAFARTDIQSDLEQQLKDIQAQIDTYTKELGQTVTQKKTLMNKIKQLQTKQKALALQIKQTALELSAVEFKIGETQKKIKANLLMEKELHLEVSDTLRKMNEIDNNIIVALITARGFSNFLDQLHEYTTLSVALDNFRASTKVVRVKREKAVKQLEAQKTEVAGLLQIKSIQQQSLASSLGEQKGLLEETKGLESNYQTILADSKKRAAEIRNRIYELFDTGKQITFGQAVETAKFVANLTGIRPAFLLAILTQESNLGKNVGTCNRVGDPPEKGWRVIMKPDRDQVPFQSITKELNFDTDKTPVSCPMRDKNGKQIGWGGAMGPAQFIPSTWMGYRAKVSSLTGKGTSNPWDIRDSFIAAAIKLVADGADGTDGGDWKAAMRYFSGSTNIRFRFYGDNVINTTNQYLQDIADLK